MAEQHYEQRSNRTGKRHYRQLPDGVPVEYCNEACHSAHSRYADCRRCEEACPTGALHVVEGGIEVTNGCVGCGQCVGACPTSAIGVAGFAVPSITSAETAPVYLDCYRVPARHSPAGSIRVPCLGGMTPSRLLALRVEAGTRPLMLLDRGWCSTCDAGNADAHPSTENMNAARALLETLRVPDTQCPTIALRPLPPSESITNPANSRNEQRLSRRAFFSNLTARVADPLIPTKQSAIAAGHERGKLRSHERDRLLEQVRILAERMQAEVPASLYPSVRIDARKCQHHQLCAATCPTGALNAVRMSGVSGVVFDASACIACGHCARICTEDALQLLPLGNGRVPEGQEVLARVRQRTCAACGRPFEGAAKDTHCMTCSKRTGLAASAFQTLFGRTN